MSKEEIKNYEIENEDLEEVMRKYDRESNVRVWQGVPAIIVKAVLIGFSLFCIWVTLFATFLEEIRLTSFMGLIILLGFLTYPASCTTPSLRSRSSSRERASRPTRSSSP